MAGLAGPVPKAAASSRLVGKLEKWPYFLGFRFIPLEEPMDAIFICKMSIAPERHIPDIIEELFVCSYGELVENCPQLVVLPPANIEGDSIALSGGSRGVEPVCSRKLHDAAFQVGESHFVMLLGWHLALHGRVADLGDSQLSTQAALVKGHSFGAVAVKK